MPIRSPTSSPLHVLVVHLGQLTEVVYSLPALGALRAQFPDTHVTLATSSSNCELISLTTAVHDFLPVGNLNAVDAIKPWNLYRWVRSLQELRRGDFDLVCDLPSYGRKNVITWLARSQIQRTVGYRRHPLDFLAALFPFHGDPTLHLVDRYFTAVRHLGVRPGQREPRLQPPPESRARIGKMLRKKLGEEKLLVALSPCQDSRTARWPLARFIELGDRLSHDLEITLLLGWKSKGTRILRDLNRRLQGDRILLDDETLPEWVAALSTCTAVITDDVETASLACAVGTPVIGLGFPAYVTPLGQEHVVIHATRTTRIGIDDVLTAASRVISRNRTVTSLSEDH